MRRLNQNSESKKGHNPVKTQLRVMVLSIQGHLMILNKCVQFQSNSIPVSEEKQLARKGLIKIFNEKRNIIQSNSIQS